MKLRDVRQEQIKVIGHLSGKKYILEKICFVKPDAYHIEIDVRLPNTSQQVDSADLDDRGECVEIDENGNLSRPSDIKRDPGG